MRADEAILHVPPIGSVSLEDALRGPFAHAEGADPVNSPMVRHLLEAMDWDVNAGTNWVPLSTYLTFAMPPYRQPGGSLPEKSFPPLPFHCVDLPGDRRIGVTVSVEAGRAMRMGERIRSECRVTAATPKATRLGAGTMVDFETRFTGDDDEVVAVERTAMLCFAHTGTAGSGRLERGASEVLTVVDRDGALLETRDPRQGQVAVANDLQLTPLRLAMVNAANRDFSPIHIDAEAAAEIGAPAPVANTMFVLAMVERLITTSLGRVDAVRALGPMRLIRPIPAGSTISTHGSVVAVHPAGPAVDIELAVVLTADGIPVSTGTATARITP